MKSNSWYATRGLSYSCHAEHVTRRESPVSCQVFSPEKLKLLQCPRTISRLVLAMIKGLQIGTERKQRAAANSVDLRFGTMP
jgi:hypothetical protein